MQISPNQPTTLQTMQLISYPDGVQMVSLVADSVMVNGVIRNEMLLRDGDLLTCQGRRTIVRQASGHWEAMALEPEQDKDPLMALVDTLAALIGRKSLGELLPLVLRSAAITLDADQGVLQSPVDNLPRLFFPGPSVAISDSIVRQALDSHEAIVWNQSENPAPLSHSMTVNRLTSIMVAPFRLAHSAKLGFLYLQRQERTQPFSAYERNLFSRFVQLCGLLADDVQRTSELHAEISVLREVKESQGLLYACEAMDKVTTLARKVASTPVPVVLQGETGTGKEVMARFIHHHSPRAAKPFVAINCGAIPANLIETILFGHVKGAFTGAIDTRKGVFEEADGGTLFLDEVADLPLDLQVKLLRVLQEKRIVRVGETGEIPVDVRIVSASHRNLEQQVTAGTFREDLFFRLSVMQLKLPPLRERGHDCIVLAKRFMDRFSKEFSLPDIHLGKSAEKALLRHSWPGNVRELENRIQKALVQCEGSMVRPEDLGLDETESSLGSGPRTLQACRDAAEKSCIGRALKDAGGNLTLAGQILGIDRKVLRDHMERLDIHKEAYQETRPK